MKNFAFGLFALAVSAGAWTARAEDEPAPIFQEKGKLTDEAPLDKKTNSHHQAFDVKLAGSQFIRVDLKSGEFKPILRVISPAGKTLFEDKTGSQSGRVFKVEKADSYRFVVAGATKQKSGEFTLTVSKASLKDRGDLLRTQVMNLAKMPAASQDGVLHDLKQYLGDKRSELASGDVQLAFKACRDLEGRADVGTIYDEMVGLLGKAPKTAEPLVNVMKGVMRRTPGHEITTLAGTTTKGEEFHWSDYKGKVVLIDFWATWCGPCRVELPNVLRLYDKYHAQGFEVVGISIDRDRKALDKYLEEHKLPWLCLYDENAKGSHPMARHYGLQFIPLPILVGRDGKVISMRARGPELARLLERHVGVK